MRFILTTILFFTVFACTSSDKKTSASSSGIVVSDLEHEEGVLSGKILNKSGRTISELTLRIVWSSPCGHEVIRRSFKVVPGGDGKSLPSGSIKHFRYNIKFETHHRRKLTLNHSIESIR